MEAVGREHAVERAGREAAREVGDDGLDAPLPGSARPRGERIVLQRPAIPVHAMIRARRPEDIGQRERERPLPRPELEPSRTGALDAGADQGDVVVVVHAPAG